MKKALGALALVLLAAGAAVAWYLTRSDSARSEGPSYPKHWDARVTELVRFVETQRGLTFKHPVAVKFMQDSDFETKVKTPKTEVAKDRAEFERFAGELRALGQLEGRPDLLDAQDELVSKSLAGLYVAKEKTLYVRGVTTTPFVRSILAHELTHALQDQHFDLDALHKRAPAGAGVATTALIEGDAVRMQEAYARQLSDGDKATFAKEELASQRLAQSTRDVPQVMQDLLRFPYEFGPTYVDALTAHGGTSGIDAAFRSPPVSEAQVVDPRRYQLDYKPQAVTDPALPTGAKALHEPAAFGQFSLFQVLGVQLGRTRAWAAVTGWSGDRYVSYQLRGRTCLAITVRMSDQPRGKALETAFREWSAPRTDATLTRNGRDVLVTTCDPGRKLNVREAQPRAFDVMAARANLIHVLLHQTPQSFTKATCVTDRVMSSLGEQAFMTFDNTRPGAQQRLNRLFGLAYERC